MPSRLVVMHQTVASFLHSLCSMKRTLLLQAHLLHPFSSFYRYRYSSTAVFLWYAIDAGEQCALTPLQLLSSLRTLLQIHQTSVIMSTPLWSKSLPPYYHHPPSVPARKPLRAQYDGPFSESTSGPTATLGPSISHQDPSDSVASPGKNSHGHNRLSRAPDVIARGMAREAAKKKAKEHKEHKKRLLAEEKARKRWLGGVAWGFDPTAGMLSSKEAYEGDGGAYVTAGRSLQGTEGVDELDEVGRRTGRRWVSHTLWGIEHGGPGKEGKYGHGSLRDREPSLDVPLRKKSRNPSPRRTDSGSPSSAALS